MYVDIHAHLDHPAFAKDLPQVIENAKQAGVKAIITQGVSHENNHVVLKLAETYDIVHAALGLYPTDAANVKVKQIEADNFMPRSKTSVEETLAFIKQNKDKIVALGEIGMDFKWSDDVATQKANFQKFIDLSEKIKKPMIIHSRKAELEVVEMLETAKSRNHVLHCFSGRKHLIKRAADAGFFFSIPPVILRLNHFQQLVEQVNIAQLLTETDCPYLAPEKDMRNEPKYVVDAVRKIAEIKGMTAEETKNNIFQNYQKLFL